MDKAKSLCEALLEDCCHSCAEGRYCNAASERGLLSSNAIAKLKAENDSTVLCALEAVLRSCEHEKTKNHIPCRVSYARRVFESVSLCSMTSSSSESDCLNTLLKICNFLIDLPFITCPLISLDYAESQKNFEETGKFHSLIFTVCFKFYIDVIGLAVPICESTSAIDCSAAVEAENVCISSESPRKLCDYVVPIFKQTVCRGLYQVLAHVGRHSWVTDESRCVAKNTLQTFLVVSGHETVGSLLAGVTDNIDRILHHRGLYRQLLGIFSSTFTSEKWKVDPSLKHRFLWCLTKLRYPNLGEFVPQVVPPLLLLVEDYEVENKVLGVSAVQHLIKNVNPADLRLYNHSDVLFEVFFQQLYSCKDTVLQVILPCLLQILMVIDYNPQTMKTIEYTKWDKVFERLLQGTEFESRLSTRRIYSSRLVDYIDAMGAAAVKHASRILRVVYSFLEVSDGDEEEARINALNVLLATVRNCWAVMPKYKDQVLKAMLRLLIDINTPGCHVFPHVLEKLEHCVQRVLVIMVRCCGSAFANLIREVVEGAKAEPLFQRVIDCLKIVLETDIKSYDLKLKTKLPC